jgi:peptide/nickel transport system substrate-binding protein
MKHFFALLVWMVVSGTALATPFVYPAAWNSSAPGEAKYGGVVHDFEFSDYETLNPFINALSPNGYLVEYGGLLVVDPRDYSFVPYMAESFTLSKDKRTFTFKLRPELKFSDGHAITADDFVTTLKIARDEEVGYSLADAFRVGDKLVQVSKVDALTLKIVFPVVTVNALENILQLTPWPNHVFGPVYASKGWQGGHGNVEDHRGRAEDCQFRCLETSGVQNG